MMAVLPPSQSGPNSLFWFCFTFTHRQLRGGAVDTIFLFCIPKASATDSRSCGALFLEQTVTHCSEQCAVRAPLPHRFQLLLNGFGVAAICQMVTNCHGRTLEANRSP